MENAQNATQVPLSFVSRFIVPGPKGDVDMRKTLSRFQEAVEAYIKENAELKPTIMAELAQYPQLGEGRLVQFVLHALRLPVGIESQERVQAAIKELESSGKIKYHTNEGGSRKGRNSGWVLAG